MIDLIGFGIRLQSIRETRGMTQEHLAGKSGLSAHYIGNLEQGVRKPSTTALIKLCHALGATPNDLLQDSLSEEMLQGLSVDISHATTLREASDVFEDILSNYLGTEDEEPECFGIPLNQIPASKEAPANDTLSSLLLRTPQQNESQK